MFIFQFTTDCQVVLQCRQRRETIWNRRRQADDRKNARG